ncbi:hypothetical protein TIFTF001_038611 [Ficus carica]|uniref:Ubiquitin-like protease family profile domain-containing protein n=1 Tax=Ficus carica TaxID=3494 RepID=A0AA88E7M0_FICCA|nr:hypothetical protein TIFTF001_038611 [Ficus carica]
MSTPRKMSEKNSSPEISPKSTQREIEVNDTKKFMSSPEMNITDPGMLFHNIVMRLTDHSSMGDALWFEVGEDLGRFSINEFCLITGMKCVGSTHLPVVESQLIARYFSTLRGVSREHLELQLSNAANLDNDDDAVKLSLLYLTFSIPLSNANSVKIDPKFFALADNIADFNDFPWGVLSWEATQTAICNSVENRVSSKRIPLKKNDKVHYSVAGFPHALLVWAYETLPTIALKFSSNYEHAIPRMLSWTTADNVKFDDVMSAFTEVGEKQPKGFVMMPTEEELKDPWVARLYLKNPCVVPNLPPKTPAPPTSSDTNSEWREFQKEIRGEVVSIQKEVVSIKKNLASLKNGQKKSNKLMRRVIKMLAANVSENGQGKGQGEAHTSFHFSSSPNTKIPKKKRVRLSRLGQRPSSSMPHDGSPSKAPNTLIHALPPGLADEPPKEILEEFRAWFPKGLLKKTLTGRYILFSKRPPRYSKTHDMLDKPHDLGCMQEEKKSWYYELATSAVWLWDEHIDVAFYYLRNKIRQFPELNQRKVTTVDTVFTAKVRSLWTVYQSAPDKFNWACCDSIFMIMLGVRVQSEASWFDVNTVLMPIHFEGLKHWALVKLDLTNWTIEVYDSLEHEGPHNSKVREGMEGLSKFIPLVAEKNSLFEFKRRDPPGNYPIPVIIMKDIPKQANGDVRYWVTDARMQLFREWMACYLWAHAKRKLEQSYKSDEDDETNY